LQNWQNFYFLCGSSAAGLTGLMFIALTFGAQLVTEKNLDQVHTFVTTNCIHFVQVFFLCAVAAIPTVTSGFMALAVVVTGFWRLCRLPKAYMSIRAAQARAQDIELSDWFMSLILPGMGYVALLVTGYAFYKDSSSASSLFAGNIIYLLIIGIKGAWDQLVWTATKVNNNK